MSYCTRILTPSTQRVAAEDLLAALDDEGFDAMLDLDAGTAEKWEQLTLAHESGDEIASIERNEVIHGSPAAEEIEEFLAELLDCKPTSAAAWLAEQLPQVKTIYTFQWLPGTEHDDGAMMLHCLMQALHQQVGGVLQADGEGFSDDEQGDHILWQFGEGAAGPWRMAVRQAGKWVRFSMNLDDPAHRAAFLRGEVPAGVSLE